MTKEEISEKLYVKIVVSKIVITGVLMHTIYRISDYIGINEKVMKFF